MHINCISCGHRFDLGRSYDDYEGLVRCPTCRSLLDVATAEGQVRRVRPGSIHAPVQQAPAQEQPSQPMPALRPAA